MYTSIHKDIQTYRQTQTTDTHTHMHTYTHTQTYRHKYRHTHIHKQLLVANEIITLADDARVGCPRMHDDARG